MCDGFKHSWFIAYCSYVHTSMSPTMKAQHGFLHSVSCPCMCMDEVEMIVRQIQLLIIQLLVEIFVFHLSQLTLLLFK